MQQAVPEQQITPAGFFSSSGTENTGGVLTGRSFTSVRQHAKDITDRWGRSSHLVLQIKQSGTQLADMGKNHSSEAFFGCDDPLESVIFSALLEIRKMQERGGTGVDP